MMMMMMTTTMMMMMMIIIIIIIIIRGNVFVTVRLLTFRREKSNLITPYTFFVLTK